MFSLIHLFLKIRHQVSGHVGEVRAASVRFSQLDNTSARFLSANNTTVSILFPSTRDEWKTWSDTEREREGKCCYSVHSCSDRHTDVSSCPVSPPASFKMWELPAAAAGVSHVDTHYVSSFTV